MLNETVYALGANRSCIRELFEYGNMRAALVGRENVLDFSLGNPCIPAPAQVERAIRDILDTLDPLSIHGYTSAPGDLATRKANKGWFFFSKHLKEHIHKAINGVSIRSIFG